MRSRDDHQSVHLQKPIFLPIMCRLSISDIKPNSQHRRQIQSLGVPSSPRVSCIGQVKRDNIVTNVAAPAPANHHKQRLNKPRSSGTTTKGGARGGISRSCRTSKEEMFVDNSRSIKFLTDGGYQDRVKVVNIGELDPPLPVVKRDAPPPGASRDEVNLWRRRSLRAVELKSLHIKQKHLPNTNFEPPPTV